LYHRRARSYCLCCFRAREDRAGITLADADKAWEIGKDEEDGTSLEVDINKDGMLSEMARLGGDLVARVVRDR